MARLSACFSEFRQAHQELALQMCQHALATCHGGPNLAGRLLRHVRVMKLGSQPPILQRSAWHGDCAPPRITARDAELANRAKCRTAMGQSLIVQRMPAAATKNNDHNKARRGDMRPRACCSSQACSTKPVPCHATFGTLTARVASRQPRPPEHGLMSQLCRAKTQLCARSPKIMSDRW